MAAAELEANLGSLFAIVANRADPADRDEVLAALAGLDVPAFALPDEPLLNAPSVGDMMLACEGTLVSGEERLLAQEATGVVVAAMTLPQRAGPAVRRCRRRGRRATARRWSSASSPPRCPRTSRRCPGSSSTAASRWPRRSAASSRASQTTMPIIETDFGTKDTATALTTLRGRLHKGSPRKVATALALFDEYVDGDALLDRLEVARSDAVTPLMFEHQLLDLAVADRRHIVLPEGDDDRILQAADIVLRRRIADLTILGDPRADPGAGGDARRRPRRGAPAQPVRR